MKRGDLVAIALSGDYGKPRPALIVQSDHFAALPSIAVLPLTSELHEQDLIRITVLPSKQNGLRQPSQIMVDKISTVPRIRAGKRIGQLEAAVMRSVDEALNNFLSLA